MGIQFTALDSTRTRAAFDGSERPAWVKLPEQWECFGFNMSGASMLLGLLDAATTFVGRRIGPRPFEDRHVGEVTIPDARRAIMAARARFDRFAPELIREDVVRNVGAEMLGGRVIVGPASIPADLLQRLEDFATFVEVASAHGADRIMWS